MRKEIESLPNENLKAAIVYNQNYLNNMLEIKAVNPQWVDESKEQEVRQILSLLYIEQNARELD